MPQFRRIKNFWTGFKRLKEARTGKRQERKKDKNGLLIARKKRGWKRPLKKNGKDKDIFLNGNAFLSIPIQANFDLHTCLFHTLNIFHNECCADHHIVWLDLSANAVPRSISTLLWSFTLHAIRDVVTYVLHLRVQCPRHAPMGQTQYYAPKL